MYAIVEIAGQQFKVEKDMELFVHRLPGEEGAAVTFDQVLLVDQDGSITLGKPIVDGVQISARILEHMKGDKVLVFKKKRRKGYQKLNGHRQQLTKIVIEAIGEGSAEKPKRTRKPKAEKETESETES
ncbi:MAG: 50S ribosomal protein L21 [Bacteroidota bacterium]